MVTGFPWTGVLFLGGYFLIIGVVGWFFRNTNRSLDKFREQQVNISHAVTQALGDLIVKSHHYHMRQRFCRVYEKQYILDLHKSFTSLGGEGLSSLIEDITKLPSEPVEEKKA